MHRISLAPVLSATRSRDSCWITSHSCRRAGSHPRVSLAELWWSWSGPAAAPREGRRGRRGCGRARRCLLGLLEDLDDAPALGGRQRPGLHDQDPVADARSVLLVVRLDLARAAQDLAVERVLHAVLDLDHDGLVHLVAHHVTLTGLAVVAVGRRHGLILHVLTHADSSVVAGACPIPSSRSRSSV